MTILTEYLVNNNLYHGDFFFFIGDNPGDDKGTNPLGFYSPLLEFCRKNPDIYYFVTSFVTS